MDTVKYGVKNISLKDFLKKIFGKVPSAKIRLSINKLKSYATEDDIFDVKNLQTFMAITNVEELKQFILDPKTQNKQIKELLKACFEDKNIYFNENAINTCSKNNIDTIISAVFDFGEGNSNAPTVTKKVAENITDEQVTEENSPAVKVLEIDLASMKKILDGCKFTVREDIDVTEFELTEQMPVILLDNFYMDIPKNLPVYYGAVAIITKNESQKVSAVGSLQLYEGKTHILLQNTKNINYKIFGEQNSFYIAVFPQSAQESFESGKNYKGEVYLVESQIDLKRLETARTTLCIDFGTSNTTVGTYGIKNPEKNEPEVVEFLDETGDTPVKRKMLPTIVYIESFNGTSVKYLFGYEALKRVIDKDYNPDASVFYEIKRWINDLDCVENVTDEKGRKTEISHRDIIQAYIDHVLNLAEQYFQRKFLKLHFTAPVKLKDTFIAEMSKMFGKDGRTIVEPGIAIDEGIAIIYNHIAEQLKTKTDSHSEKIFIIDCGGGTTDLASCEYTINTKGYSKKLDIVTRFENGDSNFGGNNVTFRILQLLKIKLAQKLQNKDEISVQSLIKDENQLLNDIDNEKKAPQENCYKNFNEQYELAETFVPTKFAKESLSKKKSKLKRNFYYLWQIAEAYKIQFYRAIMDFVSVNFSNPEDRKIGIPDVNKYYLFVRTTEDGELEKLTNPMSDIEITNNDIHRLLYADIYSLLKNVLEAYDSKNNEQELLKYNHYKLSGQSCKITLFNELLKEFIPGKYLRYGDGQKKSPDSSELKLACINGSIYYMRDTEYGEMKPNITMEKPTLIYNVCKVNVNGEIEETYMLKKGETEIKPGLDIIASNARLVRYVVMSQNGKKQNTIDFEIQKGHENYTTTTEIENSIARYSNDEDGKIGKYIAGELISINLRKENLESVYALFTVPSKNGYGFYVYCIKVATEGRDFKYYWTQKPQYYSFENTALETFFDGSR